MAKAISTERMDLWDAPDKDYRQRYEGLPDQFVWDIAGQPRIIWDGYMRVVLDLLPPPPAKVLDVGCGPGMGAKLLLERGYDVTGIDYNERGIAFARLLAGGGRFEVFDVRILAEAAELHNQFDVAVHIEVFEHIPPQYHVAVLQGIALTLRPQGLLILSVPTVNKALNKWHYKHFELNEIVGLVNTNGFRVKRVVYQDCQHPLFAPFVWMLLSNKIYDLRFARHWLRKLYFRYFNVTSRPDRANRFILQAERAQ